MRRREARRRTYSDANNHRERVAHAQEDFRSCLACGSLNTKEHHFIQTWCRGNRKWESEILCLDCYSFSWRSYKDPEFSTPQEYEKERWHKMIKNTQARFTKTGEEVSVDV